MCFINGDEPLSFPNAVWEWTKMQSSRFAEAVKMLQTFQSRSFGMRVRELIVKKKTK